MKKIYLATPAFDGKVHVPYAVSLAETYLMLAKNNIETHFQVVTSGSLLVAERNRLVKNFTMTDCTHILFIDSDLGWPAQAVMAMLDHDVDFVAGVYPSRIDRTFTFRPKLNANSSIVTHRNLLEMLYIPAGFMLVKRHVIEKMIESYPELHFKPMDPTALEGHALFNTELYNGEFWGEDYVFCKRARECGFKIYVDPVIEFDHAGTRGCLMNVLTDKPPEQTVCTVPLLQE